MHSIGVRPSHGSSTSTEIGWTPVRDRRSLIASVMGTVNFNPYDVHDIRDDLPGKLVVGRKGHLLRHDDVFFRKILDGDALFLGFKVWL